jgi:hypothetical protein
MSRKFVCWLLAPLALVVVAATEASAGWWDGPRQTMKWCSIAYDGARDCAYATRQQCQWAVSATGGTCVLNPFYPGKGQQQKPRRNWR